jgi:plasmid stabilization system protein ParE
MTRYVLNRSARADLQGIRDYLAPAPLAIRLRIINELEQGFRRAVLFPLHGRNEPELSARYNENVRSFAIRPYRIFYLPERLPLTVFAILHGAQDIPGLLRDRPLP